MSTLNKLKINKSTKGRQSAVLPNAVLPHTRMQLSNLFVVQAPALALLQKCYRYFVIEFVYTLSAILNTGTLGFKNALLVNRHPICL